METKWTQQQQTAISDRGRSVIVSAAAGSGKTAVLVERLLEILSDPDERTRVYAENIVVVTFTKDAAAQMKDRLYKALSQKMDSLGAQADDEVFSWLLRQQSALGSARISTINSFCFDLIRENADLCGVSSQFRIADDSEESVYENAALKNVLEYWGKHRREDIERLFSCFCARNDDELEQIIRSVADYMKSLAFPDYWRSQALEVCGDAQFLFEAVRAAACRGLEEVLSFAERSVPFAEGSYPAGTPNKFKNMVEEDLANIRFHLNFLRTADMERLLESPVNHEAQFTKFTNPGSKVIMENKMVFHQFCTTYRAKYEAVMEKLLRPLRYFEEDLQLQKTIVPLLLEITQDYREELFAEKCRRNSLCFDDAERIALELLGRVSPEGIVTRTPLAEALSNQYSLIMVDEYQDCNNKQDCLFKLLSCGCNGDENGLHYGSNAFLVGDVKQSIYSFRQANPRNFMNALKESTFIDQCSAQETACIYLNRNFRSSEGVIHFVNSLFARLMTLQCGEVAYNENEFLYYGAVHYDHADHITTTCLLTGEGEEETADAHAECVAAQIRKMLDDKVQVVERDGTERDCRPKDFCILLRTKECDTFIQALRDRGIAAVGEEKNDFLNRPEIRMISNILRLIDNPLTDVPAASVMLSPAYGFTTQDLLDLKTVSKRSRIYLQMQKLMQDCADAETEVPAHLEVLCRKCAEFTEQLSRMRDAADAMPLESLIMRIYDETDLLSLQSLYEDAQLRRANLQAYVRLAQDYRKYAEQTAQCGIGAWLRHLDSISGSSLELTAVPKNTEDCVSIKTIHKSKGLEYPFVFLARMNHRFSNKPSKALFLTDESGMIGLHPIDREQFSKSHTSAFRCLLADTYRRQRSEEMRLFYVALTRAQQQLFLAMDRTECMRFCYGTVKQSGKGEKKPMMSQLLQSCPEAVPEYAAEATSMLDWVMQYLLSGSEAHHLLHALEHEENCSSGHVDYVVCNASAAKPEEAEPDMLPAASVHEIDQALLQTMQQQLAFRYESQQSELISKYSVTALSHPESEFEGRLAKPSFLYKPQTGKKRALSGAKRGTAVHKMLQYMDFSRAAEDPQQELIRLEEEGFLTELETETLTPEKLTAFFASGLYRRIAASEQIDKEKQFFVKISELALPERSALRRMYAGTDGVLIGTMDLLFREDDGWVLVDYKTDHVRTAQELTDAYSLQLALYQKAAERVLGARVKQAFIYSFTLDCAIEVALDKVEFESEELP